MKKEKLAYWAGFFDGEGHVELAFTNPIPSSRRGRYMFQIWITQWTKTPYILFAELLENFGGKITKSQKNVTNIFKWHIAGPNGRQSLEALLPYLRKKKRQAELGIEMQRRMDFYRNERRGRPLPESEILDRDAILKEYSSLIEGNRPKRKLNLGQYHLLKGRKPE